MKSDLVEKNRLSLLEAIYLAVMAILALATITTPFLVTHNFLIFQEETVEVILLGLLVIISLGILLLYRREAEKSRLKCQQMLQAKMGMEDRLNEAFKYIGSLNVQIEEIRSVFSDAIKYPENKKEMKYIMEFLAGRILGIVDADWVILRIVEPETRKTLREAHVARGNAILLNSPIENEFLIQPQSERLKDYTIVTSTQRSLDLVVFCILPRRDITRNQKIFLEAIANQLQLLFLIFTSSYYKNSRAEEVHELIGASAP
ncbi:MAG: hypothetical protein V2A78_11890 [bacterium]